MKKLTCRYAKNGYFGICECDDCRRIVVITDEMRMDWLASKSVTVRRPLGGPEIFTMHSVGLREAIDRDVRTDILKKRGLV